MRADAFVAIEAQVVEGQGQLPAVAFAGPARDQVGEDRSDAQVFRRVVDAAGRHQEVQRRRAHVLHALGQQGQAIGERMMINFLRHLGVLGMAACSVRASGAGYVASFTNGTVSTAL